MAKTEEEIEFALRQGIYSFNAESEPELQRINRVAARLKKVAPMAVRVNPNVEAHTHAKITTGTYENKFGIAFEHDRRRVCPRGKLKNLRLRGVQMHIGSQITPCRAIREGRAEDVAPGQQAEGRSMRWNFSASAVVWALSISPRSPAVTPNWWKTAAAKNILTPAKLCRALAAVAATARHENFDGAGTVHFRQRWHAGHAC